MISHELEYKNSRRASVASQSAPTKAKSEVTKTFAIIKPDAYGAGKKDEIVDAILAHGFTISEEKEDTWSLEKAKEFYKEHDGKPFFEDLTAWMSRYSFPSIAKQIKRSNLRTCAKERRRCDVLEIPCGSNKL